MKFGKLDHIDGINWSLPQDHRQTTVVLNSGPVTPLVVSGGTMWNIPEWVGKVYPPKTPRKNFLKEYAKQFSTIELNATHYKSPAPETIKTWLNESGGPLLFCPKFPQSISHYRRFVNCQEITDSFLGAVVLFGDRLSHCFIQLPESLGLSRQSELLNYLSHLPRDMKFALEMRHPDWFAGSETAEELWSAMQELGITSIISDTAGRRDAVHMRLTTSSAIVRFGGNNLDVSDYSRLETWIDKLKDWSSSGLTEFQLWMHQSNSLVTPETLIFFSEKLMEKSGFKCQSPRLTENHSFDLFS